MPARPLATVDTAGGLIAVVAEFWVGWREPKNVRGGKEIGS